MAPRNSKPKPKLIPIELDYDKDSIETVTHSRRVADAAGVQESTYKKVPILETTATPLQILDFFEAFESARRVLQWTTGPKLFAVFPTHLHGTFLRYWNRQVRDAEETVDDFDEQTTAFCHTLLRGGDYDEQMDYMRTLRKPPQLTPSEFSQRFDALEDALPYLPNAPDPDDCGFSEVDRRHLFYNAMPMAWRDKYDDAGMRHRHDTIEDMELYFDKHHERDPPSDSKQHRHNSANDDSTANRNQRNGNGNRNSRNNNRGRGRGNNNNNNRNNHSGRGSIVNNNSNGNNGGRNNNGNGGRIQNSDQCPVHPHSNHTWGQCRANAFARDNNSNGNQGRRDDNRGGSNNNDNGNNRRESHVHERNNNRDSRSERRNNDSNPNERGYESNFFDLVPSDDTTQPESFFFHGGVQDELEDSCSDDDSMPDLMPRPVVYTGYDSDSDDDDDDDAFNTDDAPNDNPTATTPPESTQREAMIPTTLTIAKRINDVSGQFLFKSLLDPGGSHVLINKRALPKGAELFTSDQRKFNTTAGGLQAASHVFLHEIILPEFSYSRQVKTYQAFVFDNPTVPYDIIYGRNFLNSCGIDIRGSDLTCKWFQDVIPFHEPDYFQQNERISALLNIPTQRARRLESFLTQKVTPTTETKISVDEVVDSQDHLTPKQRRQLRDLLAQFPTLFDGKLGTYPKRKFTIELTDDAEPYHCKRPYPVPRHNLAVLKAELSRQCQLGIMIRVGESKWGMPMLVIPKKNGDIRTIDDFRELNKFIKRKPYLLPNIIDVFHRRTGYAFVTVLDLTLCYYTYELDEDSSWLCVLVTPFGKYRRKRLPMGLSQSPDWAQAAIEDALSETGLLSECVEAYIDDVVVFSNSWEEHIDHLQKVLACLERNGYKINPAKCSWAVQEVQWLGHQLTPQGVKPVKKKIQGILSIAPPTTVTHLRAFIGMVNYYRDHTPKRAELMAPLTRHTNLPKGSKIPWTKVEDDAFKAIKAMIAQEVLLYYPDPNKEFIIETDASKVQLGATIYQMNGKKKQPVAFFSRKLTPAQTRYPASDLEALCITEVFEEYRGILYGSPIRVRTDHKNLTQRDLKSQRLLHWRLLLEEFSPTFEYLKGSLNVAGDPLSRLPMLPSEEKQDLDSLESSLYECLLYYPDDVDEFPLQFDRIATAQQADPELLALADRDDYDIQTFAGTELIARRHNDRWKILIPNSMAQPTIAWYHNVLGHAGVSRLTEALLNHLWLPNAKKRISDYIRTCDDCQRNKFDGPGYGALPPRNDVADPWSEVAVDLIGPWSIELPDNTKLSISAITMIDVTTTLSEPIGIDNKTSQHCTMQFENNWLARYPRPIRCIHDQGTEFTGLAFQNMLHVNGIKSRPTTVRNPQANAVCERMTVQDMLNTSLRQPPDNVATAVELVDSCLAAASRALRSVVHSTLRTSPGALVFNRDMLLPIPLLADYNLIRERRQAVIDNNARKANLRRRFHDYQIGDEVLLLLKPLGTLAPKTEGPYEIIQVHSNGTVTILRAPNIIERLSIRRVKPYHRSDNAD